MVWQMMRTYTVGLLQSLSEDKNKPIKDGDIVNWANNKVGASLHEILGSAKTFSLQLDACAV